MDTRSQQGFNLLELMTAVAVLGILLGLGVPSFTQMIRNNRVVANTNELVVALSAARSEAVKRGLPTSVCARNAATSDVCRTGTANNWSSGWLVFVDAADKGRAELEATRFCGAAAAEARDTGEYAAFMRFALRSSLEAGYTLHNLGFRCARGAEVAS